jgi:hypothetical protein
LAPLIRGLDAFNLPADERADVLAFIESTKTDIVE